MKRVVVLGKSDLAVSLCEWILAQPDFYLVAAVPCVTQPPWFANLGQWSVANDIPIISKQAFSESSDFSGDIAVSCYFDQILSPSEIAGVKLALNVHNSLLPRHRGIAPIEWALVNGDGFQGVTVHSIDEGIDDGAIWGQLQFDLEPSMTPAEVHTLCRRYGFVLITHVLHQLDSIVPRKQEATDASYHSLSDLARLKKEQKKNLTPE